MDEVSSGLVERLANTSAVESDAFVFLQYGPAIAVDLVVRTHAMAGTCFTSYRSGSRWVGFAAVLLDGLDEKPPQIERLQLLRFCPFHIFLTRDAKSSAMAYVGSSASRLYDTLTRHFQTWRRYKGFWRGQFGEGHDPGLTYDRDSVEVAIRITTPHRSLDEEMRLIRRLKPRDNLIGQAIASPTFHFELCTPRIP